MKRLLVCPKTARGCLAAITLLCLAARAADQPGNPPGQSPPSTGNNTAQNGLDFGGPPPFGPPGNFGPPGGFGPGGPGPGGPGMQQQLPLVKQFD